LIVYLLNYGKLYPDKYLIQINYHFKNKKYSFSILTDKYN